MLFVFCFQRVEEDHESRDNDDQNINKGGHADDRDHGVTEILF